MTTAVESRPRSTDYSGDARRPAVTLVEQCWRVMAPLLEHPPPVRPYAKGSWGPRAADDVLAGYGRWHDPWVGS